MTFAAVVLAAGASSRLGEPKQLLQYPNGESLVHRAAQDALEAGAHPVIVVTGSDAARVRAAVADLPVETVGNDEWATGLASSIRCGVHTVARHATPLSAILLLTCDMPSVGVSHLRALALALESGATRVASGYGGTRGVPALIPRSEFQELLNLSGDKGAKALLMQPDTQVVALSDGTFDLDTPDDVAKWRNAIME